MPINDFRVSGGASVVLGGQYGSESKGSAVAWMASRLAKDGEYFDIVTTGNGAQSGHTCIHNGVKKVLFNLPTACVVAHDVIKPDLFTGKAGCAYLNAGSIIDLDSFKKEIELYGGDIFIHPHAAVITEEDKAAERQNGSAQTKIASTQKGVGRALARKIERSSLTAKDYAFLRPMVRLIDLNQEMVDGKSILVEVPQGVSLSLNHSGFYPHTTSRDCTVTSGLSDAGIHPYFLHRTMVVLRCFPIRVGSIIKDGQVLGQSGGHFPDQVEVSWDSLGVEAEITTVTKRVRRVFTFSKLQIQQTFSLCRPNVVFLTFCNYLKDQSELGMIVDMINDAALEVMGFAPQIIYEYGPTTDDVAYNWSVK